METADHSRSLYAAVSNQKFVQTLVAVHHTALHAGLHHVIPILHRLEDGLARQAGAPARQLFEFDGLEHHMPGFWQTLEFERTNDALGSQDLMVHAMEGELVSMLILLDITPAAPAHRFERLESHGVVARSKPTGVEFRIGVGPEDQLAGRVELSDDEELLLAGFGRNDCFIFGHWFFTLSFDPGRDQLVPAPAWIHPTASQGIAVPAKLTFVVRRGSLFSAPNGEGIAFHFVHIVE